MLDAAETNGVIVEVNASPHRLDLGGGRHHRAVGAAHGELDDATPAEVEAAYYRDLAHAEAA